MKPLAFGTACTTDIAALLAATLSAPSGLSSTEAAARHVTDGPNLLPPPKRPSLLQLFARQFSNVLVWLLVVAAIVSIALGRQHDAWFIVVALLINAGIGTYQEYSAARILADLRSLTTPQAKVYRQGKPTMIDAAGLVIGDIIILESGARVPADARVIQSHGLEINESALTGESLPQQKQSAPLTIAPRLATATNCVFMGTTVGRGRGEAVVIAIGTDTQIGHISTHLSQIVPPLSPLQSQIATFATTALWWIGGMIAVMFFAGWLLGQNPEQLLITSITLAVAAIPEGLPALITVVLVIGMRTMASHKAVVQHYAAVETLGQVQILIVDKTGTLTKNQLAVTHLITRAGDRWQSTLTDDVTSRTPHLVDALDVMQRCNDATVHALSGNDPVDAALMQFAHTHLATQDLPERQFEVPFNSEMKYMATFYKHSATKTQVYIKGAPNAVLKLCAKTSPVRSLLAAIQPLTQQGQKPLLLATALIPTAKLVRAEWNWRTIHTVLQGAVTPIGAVTFADELRSDTARTIRQAQAAGVRVVMATGDTAAVAASVGATLGLKGEPITTLATDPTALTQQLLQHDIYAEVAPATKLELVTAWQEQGYVVAMTGDGVNDSPALKKADVGLAMGRSGTDIAKDTADIVMLDDAIATIVTAIRSGRTVFRNIQKVIAYLIATNLAEVLVLFIAVLSAGLIPLPLLPAQILWINLITDSIMVVPLALEPDHADVMQRPPRKRRDPLLSRTILQNVYISSSVIVGVTLLLFTATWYHSHDIAYARTIAFTALAGTQIFNLLNARSAKRSFFELGIWSNPAVIIVCVGTLIVQFGILYLPLTQRYLNLVPLPAATVGLTFLASASIFAILELKKYVIHKHVAPAS